MSDVKTVTRKTRIQAIDFMFVGNPKAFPLTLWPDKGDTFEQRDNVFVVKLQSSNPAEEITIELRNLLFRSFREHVVDMPLEGESAVDKHLRELRENEEARQLAQSVKLANPAS